MAFSEIGKKSKVLHVGPLPPPTGGMAIVVQQFLESEVSKAFEINNIRSDILGKSEFEGWRRAIMNVLNAIVLVMIFLWRLLQIRPALVHIHTSSFVGFYEKSLLALLARATGHKVIMHVHGGAFGNFYEHSPRLLKKLIRFCLRLNYRVIVLSPQMREVLLDIGLENERVEIIGDAVLMPDSSILDRVNAMRRDFNSTVGTVTVLFLNRIAGAKGVMELIEAAPRVCERFPYVRFQIVGPHTSVCRTIREKIGAYGLTGRIQMPGGVTGEAKERAFLNADIYVLPTHVEAMSIGLLEAMSYGLACIATSVGGIPSVVKDGENGLLVPAKDSQALAEAIERLVGDGGLRRRLGEVGRRTIQQRFNWETRAQEYVDLYNAVISGR